MDVAFSKRVVGVALGFFLVSGALWSGEREPLDEGALHDCVLAGVMKTGYLVANPDATFEDLAGSQIFAGCLAAQGDTGASRDELSRGEVEEILDEDEAWREHMRRFDASRTREDRPLLRLERFEPEGR